MYGFAGAVFVLIVVLSVPLIWVAWWLLADIGEMLSGSHGQIVDLPTQQRHRPAA